MTVSKRDWLAAEQCHALAWYSRRTKPSPLTQGTRFRMEQGQAVGALARATYPDGVLVKPVGTDSAVDITSLLISDAATETIFEATFRSGPLMAKADILCRTDDGWNLFEVKSSFADTKGIDGLVADLAYTAMVAKRAGVQVRRASLMLLSRDYRYGMPAERLFETVDKTTDVEEHVVAYEKDADEIVSAVVGEECPPVVLCAQCRGCDFFSSRCLGARHGHTVLELPNLHHKKFKKLCDEGIVDLADLPQDFELTERQERVRHAALSGEPFLDPSLLSKLQELHWPCHYLDFETVATTLPLYENQACHQQVLTQFSIHHRASPDAEPTHSEFLADATKSDERALAEALIAALGTTGSVVIYSAFEKTRIKNLQVLFPDLHEPLERLIERLVDFNAVVSTHFYHPEFRGRTSIKVVLPLLVTGLSYEGLAIADGDTAIARFAQMATGTLSAEEVLATRAQLLEYCGTDTLAMVRLHEALVGIAT